MTFDRPTVFLLDTNAVEFIWKYGLATGGEVDVLSEVADLYRLGQERLAADILALDDLVKMASRGCPVFRVAPESLRELARSAEAEASDVCSWAWDLATYSAPRDWGGERRALLQAPVLHPHSTGADAVLLAETTRLGCDALVSCDYRLHRRERRIRALGPIVLRPTEAEDWLRGCGLPPWSHADMCDAWQARADFLNELALVA